MVAKAGSHLFAATALAVLVGAGLGGGDSARAQSSTCLAAPHGPAPAGTHWYYKTDQATHQKCWYTRPQDQAAQAAPAETAPPRTAQAAPSHPAPDQEQAANADSDAAAAPDEPAASVAVAPMAAAPSERATAPGPVAPRRTAVPTARVPVPTADPRGEHQPIVTATTTAPTAAGMPATPGSVAWPDPPSFAQTAGIGGAGSPFPPPPSAGPQGDGPGAAAQTQAPAAPAADSTPAPAVSAPDAPARSSAPTADTPAAGDSTGVKADAAAASTAKPPGRISMLLVLVGLIVLVIAGMLLRRLVERALGRRRVIKLARQEPRLMEPVEVPPPVPTLLRQAPSVVPGRVQTEQRVSEVESALRQLAHNLRRRRPAANGNANGAVSRSGAAVRS